MDLAVFVLVSLVTVADYRGEQLKKNWCLRLQLTDHHLPRELIHLSKGKHSKW